MEDPLWSGVSHVADLLTIIASVVVLAGVVVAVANHPRLIIKTSYEKSHKSGTVSVLHDRGIDPARFVKVLVNALTDGTPTVGDGLDSTSFLLDQQMAVRAFLPGSGYTPPPPLEWQKEAWIELADPTEVIFAISWQRPLLSWTRAVRAFRWSVEDQKNGIAPHPIQRGSTRRTLRAARIPV